jgi:hypothetical protein
VLELAKQLGSVSRLPAQLAHRVDHHLQRRESLAGKLVGDPPGADFSRALLAPGTGSETTSWHTVAPSWKTKIHMPDT